MKAQPSKRLKLAIRGAVQGVGFRPFVHRLATEHRLAGWVNNSPQGVFIEAEGSRQELEIFLNRIKTEKPPHSSIQKLEFTWLDVAGYRNFEIRDSECSGVKTTLVLPDIATCPDCLREIFDPNNRRHLYPFTNCTHCGPRFSIIESLPYDRANTTMKNFAMCPECQREYDDPQNRRFHAQPNACPVCGPRLELWSANGETIFAGHEALLAAVEMIRKGKIVAIKGVGGFHLMVDVRNENAVQLLREKKHREEKPFALLFPTLKSVKTVCEVSHLEEKLLRSPEAPIVLLKKSKAKSLKPEVAETIAPGNPNLGVMLPSNPLHHVLMRELGFPVVATSGNLSDEPICTDEGEAVERLRGIADSFLVHNRPIVRHVDDSIVRVILGREMILRRARGFAPLPIQIKNGKSQNYLAVGAHLKNSVALAVGENVFISQHIGDLETEQASYAFKRVISDFQKLYEAKPEIIAADLHPDYLSTKFAKETKVVNFNVQHHVAHVLSCVAENEIELPALGIAWDGTGFGDDKTIWGGEFFLVTKIDVQRIAHLRPFRLPGGGKAVEEPRRVALGLLYESYGEAAFEMDHLPPLQKMPPVEKITVKGMLQRGFNSPFTSSIGRLFDTVASLIDLRQQMRFEGQAAMELEFAIGDVSTDKTYKLPLLTANLPWRLDWSEMIHEILSDVTSGICIAEISAKFHNTLAEATVEIAKLVGQQRIALSGGCFQNCYLLERTIQRLCAENFQPFRHRQVPTNDGGISLGQIFAAQHGLKLK